MVLAVNRMYRKLLFIIVIVATILGYTVSKYFHHQDNLNSVVEETVVPGMVLYVRKPVDVKGLYSQWVLPDGSAIVTLYHKDYGDKVLPTDTGLIVGRVYKDYKPIGDELYAVNEFMCDVHTDGGYKFVLIFNTGTNIKAKPDGTYSGGSKTKPLMMDLDKMFILQKLVVKK